MAAVMLLGVHQYSQIIQDGVIYLKRAPGTAAIATEATNGVSHIRGQNLHSTIYAQGYQHA